MNAFCPFRRFSFVLAAAAAGLSASAAHAANWYVDNNTNIPTLPGHFKTLAAAHAAAADDDKIYFAGSATPYDGMTVTKRLHLVGVGYYLTNNSIPSANNNPAQIGTTLSLNASGSSVTGLILGDEDTLPPVIRFNAANIVISRSRFVIAGSNVPINPTGLVIRQCDVLARFTGLGDASSGCVITNSLIKAADFKLLGTNHTVSHCVFYTAANFPSVLAATTVATTCSVSNSLFLYAGTGAATLTNSGSIINCLSNNNILPAGNGNINSAALASVIVNSASPDMKFALAAGSPAIGAGMGGADMGAFGGPAPYLMSGLPPRPRIKMLTSGGISSTVTGLRVRVEAESKN